MARPLHSLGNVPPTSPFTAPDTAPESTAGLGELIKTLLAQTGELVRAEADVIKLEVQESTRAMIVDGLKAAVSAGVALLGVFSLVAFLIIALGDLLTGGVHDVRGFWLSALIVGVLFSGVGGYLAMTHAKRIGEGIGFPRTKRELRTDKEFIKDGIDKLKESATP